MVFNPLKLLPFFLLHKLSMKGRNNPRGILKFFTGWDRNDDPTYTEHIVNIRELFYGQYMFTTENYELEQRRACLQKELGKVESKLNKKTTED